ncbi:hypothetical protein [Nitrospira sp. Nam80]
MRERNGFLRQLVVLVVSVVVVGIGGCTSAPPPTPFYQDSVTSIGFQYDDHARNPHSHPAKVTPETMMDILRGVQTVSRQGVLKSLVFNRADQGPAFSSMEIRLLAPKLSAALSKAKPDELVTFYRRISDENVGLGITSGGLFVQDQQLYFVLANNRTLPTSGMGQNMVYALDPVDTPLLPIARLDFRAAFTPGTALVREEERISWPYIDDGRVLAIDLTQLHRDIRSAEK